MESDNRPLDEVTRRKFIETAAGVSALALAASELPTQAATIEPSHARYTITINGEPHELTLDSRVTLLDLLRERLHLTGTKKGCDHGQCGACTVLANGERIVSCLALAAAHAGEKITTIEGLASGGRLHPMQAAFLEHDGFQCGFCTPGQICSSVAMLQESRNGMPSAVTGNLAQKGPVELTGEEIRERMSGNICRCGAYPNIVAAVRAVYSGGGS